MPSMTLEHTDKLRATLHELETEMASLAGPELDPETRALLEETVSALQAKLAKQPVAVEPQSLADRLTASAAALEVSHPTLFGVVSRTADALSRIGI